MLPEKRKLAAQTRIKFAVRIGAVTPVVGATAAEDPSSWLRSSTRLSLSTLLLRSELLQEIKEHIEVVWHTFSKTEVGHFQMILSCRSSLLEFSITFSVRLAREMLFSEIAGYFLRVESIQPNKDESL